MATKSIGERRAQKLSQIKKLKEDLQKLEVLAVDRLGKLAVRAGLQDLDVEDSVLLKELESISSKFREKTKPPRQTSATSPPG